MDLASKIMKKQLLSLVMMLLPMMAISQNTVNIDDVYYKLSSETKEAQVTKKPSGRYTGTVDIPPSVTYEGEEYSVTSIGKAAFTSSPGLTSVTIGNNVTTIEEGAFYGCADLTSVTIGNNVTTIGDLAFGKCGGLTAVTIPNSMTTIGKYAFEGCYDLTSVSIGNSVTTIGDFAFQSCLKITSVTIPNSVTTIGKYAFEDCYDLASVIIGNGVTTIGEYAFKQCQSLTFVSLGSSLTSINTDWFAGCRISKVELFSNAIVSQNYSNGTSIGQLFGNVKEIIIGEGVTSIGDYAFNGCNKVDISSTVCKLGSNIFSKRARVDVVCRATTIPETNEDTFTNYNLSGSTLHVPEASLEAYQTTAPWSEFKNIQPIVIPSGIMAPTATRQPAIVERYNLSGRRSSQLQQGINILKMSDGTTKKVVIK